MISLIQLIYSLGQYMNFKKIFGGALSLLIVNGMSINAALAQSQPSNEVQVQKQGETDLIALTERCEAKAKPSCQARFVCTGQSAIHGSNQSAVITATRIASARAKGQLASLLGSQTKMDELTKDKSSTYEQSNGAGTSTQTQLGSLYESVVSSSAQAYLQGVVVIGSEINLSQGFVKVVVGQSCDTRNAAQEARRSSLQGEAQVTGSGAASAGDGSQVPGGPQVHYGTPQSGIEKPKNDF